MRVQFGANIIDLSKVNHVIKNEYTPHFSFYNDQGFMFDQHLTEEQHELLVDYFEIRQDNRLASGHWPSEEPAATGKFGGV